eukprot:3760739-Alexandrium_andersonii.AAC.1
MPRFAVWVAAEQRGRGDTRSANTNVAAALCPREASLAVRWADLAASLAAAAERDSRAQARRVRFRRRSGDA